MVSIQLHTFGHHEFELLHVMLGCGLFVVIVVILLAGWDVFPNGCSSTKRSHVGVPFSDCVVV